MKTLLTFSAILNLGLIGSLVFLWQKSSPKGRAASPPAVSAQPMPTAAAPAVISALPATSGPFRWAQLESSDYRIYIKNLRSIGCPEGTLRAIVTADVDVVYRERDRKLEQQLTDLANSSWSVRLSSARTEQTVKDEMLKLSGQEMAEIDDLLGLKSAPVQVAVGASSAPAGPGEVDGQAPMPPSLPLVLQDVNLATLKLNDDQKEAVAQIRQQFIDQIGGTNQDPSDPAYLARWQKAQPEMDDMLAGMIGRQAFEEYQLAGQSSGQPSETGNQ